MASKDVLTRDQDEDPFDVKARVPLYEQILCDYQQASVRARETLESQLDVRYGTHADERLDLFFPKDAGVASALLPLHIFIHGGYWHRRSKSEYSFVAESIVQMGCIAAIVDYSYLPAIRIGDVVQQVRRAVLWLKDHAATFGGDPGQMSASGHSAGAHLASYLVFRSPSEENEVDYAVSSVLLMSGIFDLKPIKASFLQPILALTDQEIQAWSPCDALPSKPAAFRILVGQKESSPMLDMARSFAAHVRSSAMHIHHFEIADEDHMTIVRSLGIPGTVCASLLKETIDAARI